MKLPPEPELVSPLNMVCALTVAATFGWTAYQLQAQDIVAKLALYFAALLAMSYFFEELVKLYREVVGDE